MRTQIKMKSVFACVVFVLLAMPWLAEADVPLTFRAYCMASAHAAGKSTLGGDAGINYARHSEVVEYPTGLTLVECWISCSSTPEGGTIRYDMSINADNSDYLGSNSLDITDGGIWIGATEQYPEGVPLELIVEFNDYYHSNPLGDFQLYRGDELLFDRQTFITTRLTLPVFAGELIDIRMDKSLSDHGHSGVINFSIVPEPATALLLLAGLPLIRRR